MGKREVVYERLMQAHGVVNCYCCGLPVSRRAATLEHIIPRSKGGARGFRNLAISHASCNVRKGSHVTPRDMELGAVRKPREPRRKLQAAASRRTIPIPLPSLDVPERVDLFLRGDWDVLRHVQQQDAIRKG